MPAVLDTHRPRNVPLIRDRIQGFWESVIASGTVVEPNAHWDARTITGAELVWVSPELAELVVDAANTVPDDLAFSDTVAPFETAFVVFPDGLRSTDGVNGQEILVDGILWGPVNLQGHDGTHLAIGSYSRHTLAYPDYWVGLGRSDWLRHQVVDDVADNLTNAPRANPAMPKNDEALAASMIEDRRLIVALWQIMAMERVVERRTWTPQSKAAKRRSKVPPRVTVLGLNTAPRRPADDDGAATQFHVRWWVRPHWRWQAVGEGRKQRRLTLVSGHVKGPDDAPFVKRERVWRVGSTNTSPPPTSPPWKG